MDLGCSLSRRRVLCSCDPRHRPRRTKEAACDERRCGWLIQGHAIALGDVIMAIPRILFALPLLAAGALTFIPGWRDWVLTASAKFTWQPGYIHAVYSGATAGPPRLPELLRTLHATSTHEMIVSGLRGLLATFLGCCLALTSVFRRRLPRQLRAGAWVESHATTLRAFQSGHPGDYVLWLTVGVAAFGSVAMWMLH